MPSPCWRLLCDRPRGENEQWKPVFVGFLPRSAHRGRQAERWETFSKACLAIWADSLGSLLLDVPNSWCQGYKRNHSENDRRVGDLGTLKRPLCKQKRMYYSTSDILSSSLGLHGQSVIPNFLADL